VLRLAAEDAAVLDVRLGGGPRTVNQFLAADLVDSLHVVVVPIVIGRGERLWDGLAGMHQRFDIQSVTVPSGATHLFFTRHRDHGDGRDACVALPVAACHVGRAALG